MSVVLCYLICAPTPVMTEVNECPDPSRRTSRAGRSRGDPSAATASGGDAPTHPRCRAPSPLLNPWAPTPPAPREWQGTLPLQHPLGPPPAGRPSFHREFAERTDFCAARINPGEHSGMPGNSDDNGTVRNGFWYCCEMDDVGTGSEVDPGHASGGTSLGPHRRSKETQQLSVTCDEHQFIGLFALHGTDHLIMGF